MIIRILQYFKYVFPSNILVVLDNIILYLSLIKNTVIINAKVGKI